MLYSIHFYYHKVGSRKPASKCEVLVFASNRERAEQLVKNMISPFHIEVEYFHIVNMGGNKSLGEIYDERPELKGISADEGYIYNEYMHKTYIRKYLK